MDCIPYINDLQLEINMLKDIKGSNNDEYIDKRIQEKTNLIEKCKDNLSKLSGYNIEYRIYLKILEGKKPSKAIEEVANENYQKDIKPASVDRLWKIYYKNLKKIIKQ